MTIKGKPDIDAFLDGGAVDTAHKATSRKRTKKKNPLSPSVLPVFTANRKSSGCPST